MLMIAYRSMKKTWIAFTLILCFAAAAFAQDTVTFQRSRSTTTEKPKNSFWQRTYVGGYFGLQFGTVTYLDVSPMVIFQAAPNFFTGVGGTYQYIRNKYYDPDYSTSAYGANVMARYHVWKDLFLQAEYDPLYLSYYPGYNTTARKQFTWIHDFLVGVGYRQWLGQRAFMTIGLFYNLNETEFSPYDNPIFRFGFGIGL